MVWQPTTITFFCIWLSAMTSDAVPRQRAGYRLVNNQASWCEARDLRMTVSRKGCEEKTFQNKVCAGQCLSYVSPHIRHADGRTENNQLSFCEFCKPSNSTTVQIQLQCLGEDNVREIATEEIEMIHECSCEKCFPDIPATSNRPNNEVVRSRPTERLSSGRTPHARDILRAEESRVITRNVAAERQGRQRRRRQ